MATRQYIGARYVPKFFEGVGGSNEWGGSSIAYEPLVVVTYLNNTYTSKKPVPVGIDISNTEYWVLTGAYNAQVEEYRQAVEECKTAISKVRNNGNWDNRKVLFVGDSYATWSGENSWANLCGTYLGCDYENIAVSGTGFDVNNVNGFLSQIQNYSGDKTAITDIIVGGGINDAENRTINGVNALNTAISNFISYANANYPNANVYIAFIGGCQVTSASFALSHTPDMIKLTQYVYSYCTRFGGTYLNGVENVLHLSPVLYGADGLHPSIDGQISIALAMCNALKTGSYVANSIFNDLGFTPTSAYTTDVSTKMSYSVNGSISNIRFSNSLNITAISSLTWNVGTDIKIGTVNTPLNLPIIIPATASLINATIDGSVMGYYNLEGTIILRGKDVYFKGVNLKADGSTFVSVVIPNNGYIGIQLKANDIAIPTVEIN